ncbi:hypothetical protein SFRURICE_002573 [Spodoptera frugiperda]|nr:hypothetical protein SFRURICE_002573 [Spodoptera frugiperda]
MIQFSGYNIAASYCRNTRGGGGVCILLQDHFEYVNKAFHDTLTNILNKSIPIRRIKIKNTHKKYWLTKSIKISCKNKRLLKTLKIKANNPIITNYYRKYEKILKQIVTTAKKIQYINKINKSNNKVKTMWSIINERTNKTFKKERTNLRLQVNNKIISEPKQIANIFNNFFTSIEGAAPCVLFADDISIITPCHDITNIESNLKNIYTTITWMNDSAEAEIFDDAAMDYRPVLVTVALGRRPWCLTRSPATSECLRGCWHAVLRVMSIKIYNKLPETLRNEKKIHVFTNKLKKILISKCYYNVKEYLDDKNII